MWGWVGLVLWVELYPLERYIDCLISVLVNMTLFGNRHFAIIINLRWGHCVLSHLVVSNSFVTPMDYSSPSSSVHGISQARILEWVAVPSSRVSSWLRVWTCVFCIGRQILYHCATWEAQKIRSLKWALIKMDCYPYRRKMHAKTETQGELTQWQAEIGVMELQAKECQKQMATSSNHQERGKEGFSPRALRGIWPSWHLISYFRMGGESILFFSLKNIYLFIWLHWVLVVAYKLFSCGMWGLVP